MSTFPYNLDVIAKVVNIRDFFVTLFFVALGMQIPVPTPWALSVAAALRCFLVATRFLSVFPLLYVTGTGLRTSLLPAINLSQMSEFSLVIAALGLSLGHVDARTVAVLTFVFVITSVALHLHDREEPRAAGAARPAACTRWACASDEGRRTRADEARRRRGHRVPRVLPRRELDRPPVRDGGAGAEDAHPLLRRACWSSTSTRRCWRS